MNFLLQIFFSFILNKIIQGWSTMDDKPPDAPTSEQGHLANDMSTEFVLPLIYGRCKVGGNKAYVSISGSDNEYAHLIFEIGEGQIYGIVREDGTTFTSTGTQFPSTNPPLLYLDGELWTDKWGDDYVYAEFFNGASDQTACATLTAEDPNWTDPKRYTAYLYLRLKYDANKWITIPKINIVVDGLLLYDPTAGTTAYSDNFALMAYDIMTRPSRRGGMGLDVWQGPVPASPRIPIADLETARAYCETKDWTGGIPLAEDVDCWEKLYTVLDCFRGDIIYSECKYKFRFRDMNHETAASIDIEEADVVTQNGRFALKIRPCGDLYELYNAIEAEFINADKEYQTDIWLKTDSAALTEDGDLRTTRKRLLGLNTLEKLQPMVAYYLERMRWGHRAELTVRDALINLEPLDLVTFTHSLPGWDQLDMRVLSIGLGESNTITLELEEEDVDLYDDEYNPSELSWHSTTLPDPQAAVPGVINVSISEVSVATRQRTHTRLVIDFDQPSSYPWWDGAQVWIRIGDDAEWRYQTKSDGGYIYEPVEEGETYRFKLVSTNIWGGVEDFSSAYEISYLVTGQSAAVPGDVTGMTAVANGDSVSIYATSPGGDDIDGFEVRLGSAWTGGLFMSFDKAPSLRLNGVRPGTHTFWMAAKNNAGNYSTNPASATVTVFIPPGFTSAHTWAWDYTTGTHSNTERYDYSGDYVLRCTHTGGVLTGTWTSATYDMSSIKIVRCWGDFLTLFIAGTSTWSGVVPDPMTWADVSAASRTWAQIFQPTSAAQLEAKLQHSENNVDWSEIGRFEVLCGEVYARYLKVEITITDPTPDEYLYVDDLNMVAYSGPT